ncbi:hypothetical protein [Streptomyces microflavus]|uniref:hypothetical protein n=1 Tax=Streptomyces microflavus TaxID=1919 RepID=UPI0036A811C3
MPESDDSGAGRALAQEVPHWPGFDHDIGGRIAALAGSGVGKEVRAELNGLLVKADGTSVPTGPPAVLVPGALSRLTALVAAYHRMIEAIVSAYSHDRRLQETLSMPDELTPWLRAPAHPRDARVHLMRVDVLPQADGTVRVLETNANCPTSFVFSGMAARAWRRVLEQHGEKLPEPLPWEREQWMAEWFLRVAEQETGERPAFVTLLKEWDGTQSPPTGDTLCAAEFDILQRLFGDLGVEAQAAHPRDLEQRSLTGVTLGGRPVRHAYLGFGVRAFSRIRAEVEPFVEAVRGGGLFVPNGLLSRWVGDNKLCLAVLSDPAFGDLFDERDVDLVGPAIPWSRNLARCPDEVVERIRRDPAGYVLKRPLDACGRGVVIGREVHDGAEWNAAVALACREGWLVQEYCTSTQLDCEPGSGTLRHDLSLGAINGVLSAATMRSSTEYRTNVARTGSFHVVFA